MTILATILHALGLDREREPPVNLPLMLDNMAAESGETLDWRHSVVDLLKVLNLDSGVDNRRRLAEELGYPGHVANDSAMNVWLHREIMARVAENGGVVPTELL